MPTFHSNPKIKYEIIVSIRTSKKLLIPKEHRLKNKSFMEISCLEDQFHVHGTCASMKTSACSMMKFQLKFIILVRDFVITSQSRIASQGWAGLNATTLEADLWSATITTAVTSMLKGFVQKWSCSCWSSSIARSFCSIRSDGDEFNAFTSLQFRYFKAKIKQKQNYYILKHALHEGLYFSG